MVRVSNENDLASTTKTKRFETDFRRRIVEGRLAPGQRLPNRSELIARFAVSSITVQQAFDGLIRDGFVESRGRAGTFVASRPPHRHRFAVVFPEKVSARFPFWTALREVAARQSGRDAEIELAIYEQVRVEHAGPDVERLTSDLRSSRVAGVIVAADPSFLPEDLRQLIDASGPAVAIMAEPSPLGWPTVYFDYSNFLERAALIAKAAGRRRIAAVCSRFHSPRIAAEFHTLIKEARLTVKPWWMLPIPPHASDAVPACMRLLMHPEQSIRPDALIIADDTLVHPALSGLIAAGVQLPGELLLIGMSNSPFVADSLPVQRVCFDACEVLRICLDLLHRKRNGKSFAKITHVPANLPHELSSDVSFSFSPLRNR